MSATPCGVDGCPALASSADGLCCVHIGAKRLAHVMAGAKCQVCARALAVGEWVTRDSTLTELRHAVCPPRRPAVPRKVDREKPLLHVGDST